LSGLEQKQKSYRCRSRLQRGPSLEKKPFSAVPWSTTFLFLLKLRDLGAPALNEHAEHDDEEQARDYLDDRDAVHINSPFVLCWVRLRNLAATALDENTQHDDKKHTGYNLDQSSAHDKSPFLQDGCCGLNYETLLRRRWIRTPSTMTKSAPETIWMSVTLVMANLPSLVFEKLFE
jgi:hypothetical protein